MKLIDSHAHVYVDAFDDDRNSIIDRADEAGVEHIIMPNIDRSSWIHAVKTEENYPDRCHLSIGLHPCSVKADYEDQLLFFESMLRDRSYAAIGETGIDLYWDKSSLDEQKRSFDRQITWAGDLGLPLIIHSRESLDLTIEMVAERQDGRLIPIFHCFTGTVEQARKIIDIGGYMGIGGVLTYKNSGLKAVIAQLTLDNLLLETDSPYLPPTPKRGKRNEPAYIRFVLRHLADAMDEEEAAVAAQTTLNAQNVFGKYLKYKCL